MSPDPPREYRFEAPGLQVPHDIDEAADEDRGDARARALLEANGVTTDPPSLEAALAGDTEVLRAAAARILAPTPSGSPARRSRSSRPAPGTPIGSRRPTRSSGWAGGGPASPR